MPDPTDKLWNLLNRGHLLNRLNTGKDHRLLLISGPAGSGKTSLVCQWIRQNNLPVLWYLLDEADNQPRHFFHYLLTLLGSLDNRLARATQLQPQGLNQLSGKEGIALILENLNEPAEDCYLVLDNFHLIINKEIQDAFYYFLRYLPQKIHVVILSRSPLPIPLSPFRIENQVVEIFPEDLKLTKEESLLFFRKMIGATLSEEQIATLAKPAEGWIGGLCFISLAVQGSQPEDGLNDVIQRACQQAINYLREEVLFVQSEKVRDFLAKTALLNRFNADLCREITGREDAGEILEYCFQAGLFLIPLDPTRQWYRYQLMFAEALRQELRSSSPEFIRQVHYKAACWLVKNSLLEDAFQQAFASDDFEFAADLMEEGFSLYYKNYETAWALKWLSKLPQPVLPDRPLLRLFECILKLELNQFNSIDFTLSDIENRWPHIFDQYTGFKKTMAYDLFLYLKTLSTSNLNLVSISVNQLHKSFRGISSDNKFTSGLLKTDLASSYLLQGDPQMADKFLKEAFKLFYPFEGMMARIYWLRVKSFAEVSRLNLSRATACIQDGFHYLDREKVEETHPFRWVLYYPMAWICYLQNDLPMALDYATRCVESAGQIGAINEIILGNVLLSGIYQGLGQWEKAITILQNSQTISQENGIPGINSLINSMLSFYWMKQGDFGLAEQWFDQRKLRLDEPFSGFFELDCLLQASFSLYQKRYSEANTLLEGLRSRSLKYNVGIFLIDIFQASVLWGLKDRQQAKGLLERTLSLAAKVGCIRPFIDSHPHILPVLIDLSRDRLMPPIQAQLGKVLAALGLERPLSLPLTHKTANSPENLTPRELEILRMVAAGYKNREIAEQAFVSLATVKTHIEHIYEKLKVANRLQAVTRAQELNLLKISPRLQ